MAILESLLPELDHEWTMARTSLERVPGDQLAWKPHDKSPAMGWLAGHIANIPTWGTIAMTGTELDMEPGGQRIEPPPEPETPDELLETFDKNLADMRAAVKGAADADFIVEWSLLMNGANVMTMPRIAVIRSFVINHMIHHRAQLGVYLRLNDVPVPSIYGPSADENPLKK